MTQLADSIEQKHTNLEGKSAVRLSYDCKRLKIKQQCVFKMTLKAKQTPKTHPLVPKIYR